jgi:hypothetical protein
VTASSPPRTGTFSFTLGSLTLRELDSATSPALDEAITRTVEKARRQTLTELVQSQRD